MEVILTQDIPSLGSAGEVVRVKDGYGRNFLLPQKKAVPSTEANRRRFEVERKAIEERRKKRKGEAELLAEKIRSIRVVMARDLGEEGKIFGSVTSRQIAQAVSAQGVPLDHRQLKVKSPIRTTGEHAVEVHLEWGVVTTVTVEVKSR